MYGALGQEECRPVDQLLVRVVEHRAADRAGIRDSCDAHARIRSIQSGAM